MYIDLKFDPSCNGSTGKGVLVITPFLSIYVHSYVKGQDSHNCLLGPLLFGSLLLNS